MRFPILLDYFNEKTPIKTKNYSQRWSIKHVPIIINKLKTLLPYDNICHVSFQYRQGTTSGYFTWQMLTNYNIFEAFSTVMRCHRLANHRCLFLICKGGVDDITTTSYIMIWWFNKYAHAQSHDNSYFGRPLDFICSGMCFAVYSHAWHG